MAKAENDVNETSVSIALASAANPLSSTAGNFGQARSKFWEVLFYNNTTGSRASFNKQAGDGVDPTFYGFDIMAMTNSSGEVGLHMLDADCSSPPYPTVPPYSTVIQQIIISEANFTGTTIDITIEEYPGVEIYILARPNQ
jgi:hypothetical protein